MIGQNSTSLERGAEARGLIDTVPPAQHKFPVR